MLPVVAEWNIDGKLNRPSFEICSDSSETVFKYINVFCPLRSIHFVSISSSRDSSTRPTILPLTITHQSKTKSSHPTKIKMTSRYQDNFRHTSLSNDFHRLITPPTSRNNSVAEPATAQQTKRKQSFVGKFFAGGVRPEEAYRRSGSVGSLSGNAKKSAPPMQRSWRFGTIW